jgi:hypothetical protein
VEVKAIDDPENPGGSLVLCRSAQRREKELAMLSQAEERFLADVKALQKRVSGGKLKDPGKIERAVGRLQKKHPRRRALPQPAGGRWRLDSEPC